MIWGVRIFGKGNEIIVIIGEIVCCIKTIYTTAKIFKTKPGMVFKNF